MDFFIYQGPIKGVEGTYNLWFVFLSFIIATLAARIALFILQATYNQQHHSRKRSCMLGALVMGIGIWSMHFIGMLALKMDMEHTYQLGMTILSLGLAVGFSFFVFLNITQEYLSFKRVMLNAPLLGLGIALMHYTGMAAMQMEGETRYIPSYFFLSIGIAIFASGTAMTLMRHITHAHLYKEYLNIAISITIGVAVCGMHYTGMEATVFIPYATCRFTPNQDSYTLIAIVSIGALFIFSVGIYLVMRGFLSVKQAQDNIFSGPGFIIVNILIILVGITFISLIYIQAQQNYSIVNYRFIEQQRYKAQHTLKKIQSFFQTIYNNLYVLSLFPFLQTPERFSHLTPEEKKILHSVSSVLTLKIPHANFKIAYHSSASSFQENKNFFTVFNLKGERAEKERDLSFFLKEIFRTLENKYLPKSKEQGSVFSNATVSLPSLKGALPKDDYLIYSLPLSNEAEELTGVVFTLLQVSVFQYLLEHFDAVLINSQEKIYIMPLSPSLMLQSSREWIQQGLPNPHLFYSEVLTVDIGDNNNSWKLWVGADNTLFSNSLEMRNLSYFHLSSYCIIAAITLLLLGLFNLMRRKYALEQQGLVYAKEAAELSNKMKSEYLSNISHELRTPIHAILNYAALGLKKPVIPEKLEKYLHNIDKAGTRLSALLDNLLNLAKMEAGKMIFHYKENNFKEVVEQALSELESLMIQKELQCNWSYQAREVFVFDKERIIQVLINLLSNAIKFSPPSSILLISIQETQEGEPGIQCKIEDEGVGIPPSEIELIFEKFTQSSQTKTGAGGTGLGLAICKDIISNHKGKIWAENRLQGGAAFYFFIPLTLSVDC